MGEIGKAGRTGGIFAGFDTPKNFGIRMQHLCLRSHAKFSASNRENSRQRLDHSVAIVLVMPGMQSCCSAAV